MYCIEDKLVQCSMGGGGGCGLWGVALCLDAAIWVSQIMAPSLAPGGDEIARVDDFDMPEHHVKTVNPCYFIATRGNA